MATNRLRPTSSEEEADTKSRRKSEEVHPNHPHRTFRRLAEAMTSPPALLAVDMEDSKSKVAAAMNPHLLLDPATVTAEQETETTENQLLRQLEVTAISTKEKVLCCSVLFQFQSIRQVKEDAANLSLHHIHHFLLLADEGGGGSSYDGGSAPLRPQPAHPPSGGGYGSAPPPRPAPPPAPALLRRRKWRLWGDLPAADTEVTDHLLLVHVQFNQHLLLLMTAGEATAAHHLHLVSEADLVLRADTAAEVTAAEAEAIEDLPAVESAAETDWLLVLNPQRQFNPNAMVAEATEHPQRPSDGGGEYGGGSSAPPPRPAHLYRCIWRAAGNQQAAAPSGGGGGSAPLRPSSGRYGGGGGYGAPRPQQPVPSYSYGGESAPPPRPSTGGYGGGGSIQHQQQQGDYGGGEGGGYGGGSALLRPQQSAAPAGYGGDVNYSLYFYSF